MREIVAAAYESRERAEAALDEVRRLAREHALELRDAAVVARAPDGRLELHQTHQWAAGEGVVAGGSVGLVLGLVVGFPVAVALLGMAAGGGFGAFDTGIPDERLRALGDGLAPGDALLCALVDDADRDLLLKRIAPYRGEAIVSAVGTDARSPDPP
jgi:uncharacterized membrane protein